MKKLQYSPDAFEKLKQIRQYVTQNFGTDKANDIINNMTKSFQDLRQFENKGVLVEGVLNIPCDYRMIYIQHNYVFYRIDGDIIKIVDIYNEKEDFMWKLFGIKTTSQESEDYWGE